MTAPASSKFPSGMMMGGMSSGGGGGGGGMLASAFGLPSSNPSSSSTLSFSGLNLGGSVGLSSPPSSFSSSSLPAAFFGSQQQRLASANVPPPIPVSLRPKPVLNKTDFDSKWAGLETVEVWGATLRADVVIADAGFSIEKLLADSFIACFASGNISGGSKHYFFAQELESGRLCMCEFTITEASKRISAIMKAPDAALGASFADIFKTTLARTKLLEVGNSV